MSNHIKSIELSKLKRKGTANGGLVCFYRQAFTMLHCLAKNKSRIMMFLSSWKHVFRITEWQYFNQFLPNVPDPKGT